MGIRFCGKLKCLYRLYRYNKQCSGIAVLGYKRYKDGEQTGRDTADSLPCFILMSRSHASLPCLSPMSLSTISHSHMSLSPIYLSPMSLACLAPLTLPWLSSLCLLSKGDRGVRQGRERRERSRGERQGRKTKKRGEGKRRR